jgi:hypothetical protein
MDELKKLLALLKQCQDVAAELGRLDAHERDARKQLKAAADYDLSSEMAQRKIGEARSTLDLIGERRKKLTAPHEAIRSDLEKQFRAVGEEWNRRIDKGRQRVIEALVAANLPFYNNDEKACNKALSGEGFEVIPCAWTWRRARFTFPFAPNPKDLDLEDVVKGLIRHIERHSKALGW